jgi:hypothetical protein
MSNRFSLSSPAVLVQVGCEFHDPLVFLKQDIRVGRMMYINLPHPLRLRCTNTTLQIMTW